MSWNEKKYQEYKAKVNSDIQLGLKSNYDYMEKYKEMVVSENYEACKAMTEVLAENDVHTAETHKYIPSLN